MPLDARDAAILDATINELVTSGVTGLRMAVVAKNSGEPIATMYRRFVDREGLVAAALLRRYNERLRRLLDAGQALADQSGPLSLDDIVAITPQPFDVVDPDYRLTEQMLWLATERAHLAEEIKVRRAAQRRELHDILVRLNARLPHEDQFDPRIYTMLVLNLSLIQNVLCGDEAMGAVEYREFLTKLLRDSRPN